jgi:uncharacterized membrane protein
VFSFPPDKGNVGTAAYLNVFGSIFRVLQNLKRVGYDVGPLPNNETELIQSVLQASVLWGPVAGVSCSVAVCVLGCNSLLPVSVSCVEKLPVLFSVHFSG